MLCLVAFPFGWLGLPATGALLFAALGSDGQPELRLAEFWRFLTPAFLHFSWWHLGFNCALFIELGRRIEGSLGTATLLLAVAVLAIVSNAAQFAWSGHPVFGGLSGAVYGMVGFLLVASRRAPDVAALQLRPEFALMLLIFLVLFTTGITEGFGVYVANAAHWAGFVGGLALAALWPLGTTREA